MGLRFKPSAAHRWMLGGCSGSVAAEAAMKTVPTEPSLMAEQGNRLHDLAAGVLKGELEPEVVDPAEWDEIKDYVEDVQKAACLYNSPIVVERWLDHPDHPGKPDAYLFTNTSLIVWELKTGFNPVDAKRNAQLMLYALMLLSDKPPGIRVELRIVQPNGYHVDGVVRSWTVTGTEITGWRKARDLAVIEANRPSPRLVASPSNCRHCKALSSCKAVTSVALGGMDTALDQTGAISADSMRNVLVDLRVAENLVKRQLAAVESEALARIKNGEFIPGLVMSSGRGGALVWDAPDEKIKILCGLVGHDPTVTSLRTPTQMISAGVDEDIINKLTRRTKSSSKLSTDANAELEKMFPTS